MFLIEVMDSHHPQNHGSVIYSEKSEDGKSRTLIRAQTYANKFRGKPRCVEVTDLDTGNSAAFSGRSNVPTFVWNDL